MIFEDNLASCKKVFAIRFCHDIHLLLSAHQGLIYDVTVNMIHDNIRIRLLGHLLITVVLYSSVIPEKML